MGYLICDKCGGYYELQENESPDTFIECQCGGKLKYHETMYDYVNFDIYHRKNPLSYKEELNQELNMYNAWKKSESEYKHQKYEINRHKFFSENFVTNSGFITLTFAIVPLFFGTCYSNWIFYLISGISFIMSITYFFLNNIEDKLRNSYFQKIFIFTGIIFGLTALSLLTLLLNKEFIYDLFEPAVYNRGGFIMAYISSLAFSSYLSYLFFKNSLMEERIDLLNSSNKERLYLGYYPLIFMFFIIMIAGMVLTIWSK